MGSIPVGDVISFHFMQDDEQQSLDSLTLLNPLELSSYLSEGGSLSRLSDSFEERPVQINLLKNITNAFNNSSIGVFEADTGVGKSFAYLIPSIIWALKNNQKVIISTGTINLQQQLCQKDIPFVKKIIGKDFKFLLMKGRQNYICIRRYQEASLQRELFGEDTEIFDKLSEWLKTTETGSRSEIDFMPPESIWSKINSESDACMGKRCPFYSECFVMKVRKEAANANLIVVNHHLLFADLQGRMSGAGYDDTVVLPPYRYIVFDEAHGMESAATSFFSESINRFTIIKQMNQLYRRRKNSDTGYLCTLALLSSNEEKVSQAYELTNRIKNDITNLEIASLDILQTEYNMRLYNQTSRLFSPLLSLCNTLASSIDSFTGLCREIMERIGEEDKEVPAFWETKVHVKRLEAVCLLLRDFCVWDEKQDDVFWISKKSLSKDNSKDLDSKYIVFTKTPLDIAPLMNAGLFEPMNSVVCTSATIKAGRDFSYWLRRTGAFFCDHERLLTGEYPSNFPYSKNMLFAVPSDGPLPEESFKFQQWIDAAITTLIKASYGRTLVLFTSYESLKSSYDFAFKFLRGFECELLRQGMDDNSRILKKFKEDVTSVLFATDSFWQGVDVPGDSLSQVIIVKLPFTVPNDPVFTARSEAIQKRGGSSFMELSIPEAVIKFRQGIGRLVRRSSDKGVVTVLDKRIYEKRYGSIFLSCVPECKRLYVPLQEIAQAISKFV